MRRRCLSVLAAALLAASVLVSSASSQATAPAAPTIDAGPANPTNATSATFSFTPAEGTSAECGLDGAAFAACRSPHSYPNSDTPDALTEGPHTFSVRSVSPHGVSEPTSYSWYIDLTPPTLDAHGNQTVPQDSIAGAQVTYSPSVTAQDDVDAAPEIACNPVDGDSFPLGDTTVTCTATDDAGNTSSPLTFTVTVERVVPDAPVITEQPPPLTNSTGAHFAFTTSGTLTSIRCQLDGEPSADCTGSHDYAALAEGSHRFTVQVTNEFGNSNEAVYDWTIDITKPGPITDFRARAAPGSATLRWNLPADVDFDHVQIERRRAGTTTWKTIAQRNATSYTDKDLANEVLYHYRAVAVDKAANPSDAAFASARPSRVFAPQYLATVNPPVLIDWTSIRDARYYNMQIWRGGRKILSVWPGRSRYRVPSSWTFQGRRYAINERRHDVYVWPGFGPKAAARYGRLVGSTSFFGA